MAKPGGKADAVGEEQQSLIERRAAPRLPGSRLLPCVIWLSTMPLQYLVHEDIQNIVLRVRENHATKVYDSEQDFISAN